MIEINLIPDVKQELIRTQRARAKVVSLSITISIVAIATVAALLVYMFAVQGVRGLVLDSQIDSKGKQLAKVDDLSKILTIQNQLATINQLNDQKTMSSRVFDTVVAISPTNEANSVSFSRVTVGGSGTSTTSSSSSSAANPTIQLEGQTAGYSSMEAFKKTVENTIIQYKEGDEVKTTRLASAVSTSDVSYGEDANGKKVLRFTLSFDYPSELFSPKIKDVAFKLDVNGNVTDSYLGIPRFTDRAKDLGDS